MRARNVICLLLPGLAVTIAAGALVLFALLRDPGTSQATRTRFRSRYSDFISSATKGST